MVELLPGLRSPPLKALSEEQVAGYDRDGYMLPARRAIPTEEAKALRAELEALELAEQKAAGLVIYHGHVRYPWLHRLASAPAILDAVEDLIGPNILLWSSAAFAKEPGSDAFISWHQDCNYWGIEPYDGIVTAWVALTDVGCDSGPMDFLRGSHLRDPLPQEETYNPDNLLSRGQEIKWTSPIDPSKVAQATMLAGEFSLHHVKIAHGSGVNRGKDRRIGLALRYMPTCSRTVNKRDMAMLVRGEDTFGNFELQPPPKAADDPAAVEQQKIGYALHQTNSMSTSDPEKAAKKRCLGSNRNQPEHLIAHTAITVSS